MDRTSTIRRGLALALVMVGTGWACTSFPTTAIYWASSSSLEKLAK
jgi:hypothetical protein